MSVVCAVSLNQVIIAANHRPVFVHSSEPIRIRSQSERIYRLSVTDKHNSAKI